ncbi:hypothetical protein Bbelb_137090 [Branchiostoma belcheri]|nr:hypothetical protein Bbelb_137090 [Branchiostoma belcheri]
MALNPKKCKVLQICFAKVPPPPEPLIISEQTLVTVTCIKVLGLTIQNNLKWDQQVDSMVKSSNRRLYMVRRLKRFGVSVPDLVSVYTVYVRPLLEYAVPVWHPALTTKQSKTLERIQTRACKIILGSQYSSYNMALTTLNLSSLADRRRELCRAFAESLLNSDSWDSGQEPFIPQSPCSRCERFDALDSIEFNIKHYSRKKQVHAFL